MSASPPGAAADPGLGAPLAAQVGTPMLDVCCTLLHTDGVLLVAQQCCIRWALLHTPAKHAQHTPLGTPPRTPSWGAAAFGIPSAGPPVRLLCCFVLQTIRVFACCKQCCTGESTASTKTRQRRPWPGLLCLVYGTCRTARVGTGRPALGAPSAAHSAAWVRVLMGRAAREVAAGRQVAAHGEGDPRAVVGGEPADGLQPPQGTVRQQQRL